MKFINFDEEFLRKVQYKMYGFPTIRKKGRFKEFGYVISISKHDESYG